ATDVPEAEAEVVGRITNLQGKNKFIVIDEKFFYSLVTKAGGGADGVEIAVNAVFSPDIIQNLKQGNIGLIIKQNSGLVSTDGSGKEIKVDLHSFMANVLQKMGVPENSFLIFDAKTAAVVQNSSEPVPVTWDSVKQGLQRQFGDNIHVHAIAPEADIDEMKNLKKSNQDSVTYTTFTEFGENSTALRIGDAFITEALKTMILGTNKQLTDSDKQALAGAILATINVDMTKVGGRKGLADIMGKKLNSLEDPDTKTVNLDKAIVAWVAPEKWA
ncbi:MAG: hypothetical protein PHO30_06015, partial [Candidatus Omnitrophica bacterium]|nr:hypothetical protein [Candidatus Omnitrophota bacterium]